ncbi:MAG: EAL domain-containing protein [Candidatus Marinarcus sp.]|uniref:EAL domain-containing protein n=1 Tax=Candidatus Marinarcus sp. TaxID=3100987 RepID=UPI003B0028D9
MRNKFFIKNPLQLILLTAGVSFVLMLLLYGTVRLEDKIENKMLQLSTSDVFSIAKNNAQSIEYVLKGSSNYIEDIKQQVRLQDNIENHLKILMTKNIKYAYLLYRDKKGVFRFLADASKPSEKAVLNQKFDIDNEEWIQIYENKEPQIIRHTVLHELSITYLVPILYEDQVQLILAIDFSIKKVEDINQIISVMKNGILGIIFVTTLFLIILIIQTVRYSAVKKSAFIDKLTNVYNRNYLQESEDFINLNDYILATLDIDHFKKVNDMYGHDVGDKILKQVANTILLTVRNKEDIIIRYGGEEFLILAKVTRDEHVSALNVIERIFRNIQENRFYISKKDYIDVTVSIGVNLVPQKSRTFSEAFKLADIALYNAKNKGRNTIEIYDEHEDISSSCLSINEIKEAMEANRVVCFYQAIVDTHTQAISHYEALLRIIDTNSEVVTPDKILPVIQGTFILRNITKCVLDICYKRLLEDSTVQINVNLNPQDIINESILSILKQYATDKNIANRLGLELIETEDIITCSDAKENLLMLKNLGYKIFIDDFGSGYSNFIYLTEIKTDYIKIDGNIIKKILEDRTSYLLVKSIVNFAKEANIKVIAEYVSSEEIWDKIKALGIEYSQGYHFSIPAAFDTKESKKRVD